MRMLKGTKAAVVGLLVCAIAVSSALAASEAKRFTVTSTLDGKKVLPHRIRWLAYPKLPRSEVTQVAFLIDGKVRWIELKPPYTYGGDERSGGGTVLFRNWLVTSWLSPGRHRFTVRAKAKGGSTAQRTTIARVLPAPAPPAELAGTWKRDVAGFGGTWVLTVNKVGWRFRDPFGTGSLIDVAYLSDGRLQARGGIWTKPHNRQEGNGWCEGTNAPVNYRWAVSANTLTLTLNGRDRCGKGREAQHFVWAGAWTKVG
jgi:hypothetical protein